MSKTAEASPVPDAWYWPDFCEAEVEGGRPCGGQVVARARILGQPIYICAAHTVVPPFHESRRADVDRLR